MSSNLYEILGVQKNASPDDGKSLENMHPYSALCILMPTSPYSVRKAFKKRALQTHPDKLPQRHTADQKAQAGRTVPSSE